jgi:hypothetical protein
MKYKKNLLALAALFWVYGCSSPNNKESKLENRDTQRDAVENKLIEKVLTLEEYKELAHRCDSLNFPIRFAFDTIVENGNKLILVKVDSEDSFRYFTMQNYFYYKNTDSHSFG